VTRINLVLSARRYKIKCRHM